MPEFNEYAIDCPDIAEEGKTHSMHVYEWGSRQNNNVLVCVHGLTRNGRDFDFLAQALQDSYRILCPDIVGRGKSEYLSYAGEYNYMTYVADILHMLEHFKISQCKWLGTSMGGLIGMMIAANVQGVVKQLVINDIGPFLPKEGLNRIGEYVGNDPQFTQREEAETHLRDIFLPWGISDEKALAHMIDNSLVEKDGSFSLAYDSHIGDMFKDENGNPKDMEDIDLWEVWETVDCPVLLLRGIKSDVLPQQVAARMAEKKNCELVEFENIGHAPSLMEEEQIKIVREWLGS